jgi:hypothetical protein
LGTTVIGDTTAFNAPTGTANGRSFVDGYIFVNSVGSSASILLEMTGYFIPVAAGTGAVTYFDGSVGGATVDLTTNQTLDVTVQWGTASASNAITMQRASLERIR